MLEQYCQWKRHPSEYICGSDISSSHLKQKEISEINFNGTFS